MLGRAFLKLFITRKSVGVEDLHAFFVGGFDVLGRSVIVEAENIKRFDAIHAAPFVSFAFRFFCDGPL